MNSSELRGFLTGLILGDGTIDKGITKRAFRIKSINFDFVDYIKNKISKNTNFKIRVKTFESTIKEGVHRKPYRELTIISHPYFAKKYHYFYNDNRERRIVTDTLKWLTPEGLANWYMSDGYITLVGKTKGKIVDRRVELSTDRYTYDDVLKIKKYFEDIHNYKIKIVDRKRDAQFRLRISLLDAQNFFLMIAPHVVPSLRYKLNMSYDYQPKWMSDEYYNLMMKITEREASSCSDTEDDDIVCVAI